MQERDEARRTDLKAKEEMGGMEAIIQEQHFDRNDVEMAGLALLEVMHEHPTLDMEIWQDLAAEQALVSQHIVHAAMWEQTERGYLKLTNGFKFELSDEGRKEIEEKNPKIDIPTFGGPA